MFYFHKETTKNGDGLRTQTQKQKGVNSPLIMTDHLVSQSISLWLF